MTRPGRILLKGAHVGFSIALFLAILVVVALVAQGHPYRVDVTKSGKHSLSSQTEKIVASISEPVEIKAFYQESQQERGSVKDLLDSYSYLSPKVTYSFVDPDRQPAVAREFDVKTYGTLTLIGYGKKETITMPDEQTLTRALIRLMSNKKKTIYFLSGHGERSIEDFEKAGLDSLKSDLAKANYEVKELNLMRGAIPEDATVVVIAAPEKPLFKEEINALENYTDHGGRLLVMLPPFKDGGLKDLLARYGFELKDDIVIDQVSRLFGGDYLIPMVNSYGRHEITERFTLASFFPLSRGVWKTEKTPDGVQVTMLASTSPESWAETDQESLNKGTVEFQEKKDEIGPVWIAAIAQIPPDFKGGEKEEAVQQEKGAEPETQTGADAKVSSPDKAVDAQPAGESAQEQKEPQESKKEEQSPPTQREPGQLALVGSVDFASNAYLGMSGNYDFVLNTISFLAKDKEQIAIRPKTKEMDTLTLTESQSVLLFWISLVCMPALILIAGLTAYRIRRKSR